jgi:rhodanese-related sulfurtransferase
MSAADHDPDRTRGRPSAQAGPTPILRAVDVDQVACLIDVREPDEWRAGHPPGAVHLPMMSVPARLSDVPATGDVVVVCRSGARSGQVVAYLRRQGFAHVRNLDGGLLGWVAAGRPLVSEDGGAGIVL